MINFLTLPKKTGPISRYFQSWGRELARRVNIFSYDTVDNPRRLPYGAYVFADVDRLSGSEAEHAQFIWDTLAKRRPRLPQLYNDPKRCVRRYDFLRQLYQAGQNDFNVYRLAEIGPAVRFPAFIRYAERHTGTLTRLLPDMKRLRAAADRLAAAGHKLDDLLVVEFQDTSSEGVFRKFSAMKVAGRIIPHHILFSTDWHVKAASFIPWSPAMTAEEASFQLENPHYAEINAAFELAQVDFGRVDYGVKDGRVQLWEINTNPLLLPPPEFYTAYQMPNKLRFAAALNAGLKAMDQNTKLPWAFIAQFYRSV